MQSMFEAQRRQQEAQDRINQQQFGLNNSPQNSNQGQWGNTQQNTNNLIPSMVWTPVDKNNPSHQYFIRPA
jgi:hypothetical protein